MCTGMEIKPQSRVMIFFFFFFFTECVQQTTDSQLDTQEVASDLQKLSLSRDHLSPRSTEMNIKEWIRQTSAVAVAPDSLISGETRDTNSPTLTESSSANSVKVGMAIIIYCSLIPLLHCILLRAYQSNCSQEAVDKLKQRVDYLESKLEEVSALLCYFELESICSTPISLI